MFLIVAAICFGVSVFFALAEIISWDTFMICVMIFTLGAARVEKD